MIMFHFPVDAKLILGSRPYRPYSSRKNISDIEYKNRFVVIDILRVPLKIVLFYPGVLLLFPDVFLSLLIFFTIFSMHFFLFFFLLSLL